MNILPKELENIILNYKKDLEITEKYNRVLNQLKKRYKYDLDEYNKATINFYDKNIVYSYSSCQDGNKRFKIEYLYVNDCNDKEIIYQYYKDYEPLKNAYITFFVEKFITCKTCYVLLECEYDLCDCCYSNSDSEL
jgi:hypothetical protein